MVNIRFSFLILAAIFIALGQIEQFFMLFAAVTLHECAHVMTARHFGYKTAKFSVTALGEVALIEGMAMMRGWQRYATLLAGPACNALLYVGATFAASRLPFGQSAARLFALYNAALCLFNLLPAFPLDGARLAQIAIGNHFGVLPADRFLIRVSRWIGAFLIVTGCVQVVLYPYNISLICMGAFIRKMNRHNLLQMTYEFIQAVQRKPQRLAASGALPVKTVMTHVKTPLVRVVDRFGWDTMTVVWPVDEAGGANDGPVITETVIMRHVVLYGLSGTLGDVDKKTGGL